MKKALLIALALLLGLGAFWGYRRLFPSHQAQIRRLLVRTAQAASVRPGEGVIQKLNAINTVVGACTVDIEVLLDAAGLQQNIRGQEQLREVLAAVRGSTETIAIELGAIEVELTGDRAGAVARFVARARVSGVEDEMVQEFRIELNRAEGSWKIHRVEPLRSLQI